MWRKIGLISLVIGLLWGGMYPVQHPTAAQGPDGWTLYELNLRSGPNSSEIISILPVETGLIFEARNADMSWLLGHTVNGTARGWVASGYLRYADGFAAMRLPISDEIVSAVPAALAEPNTPDAATAPVEDTATNQSGTGANGTIAALTLIYESHHTEYYRLVYWSEGARVNGFIGFPKASGPHPAIIYNRGGVWDSGALNGTEIIPFVETGYVAAATQYRGNAGSEGSESLGYGDVQDVVNLITLLQVHPKVDPWRIGMLGGSRGGMVTYMTLKSESLTGQNRIRAAVTIGGIADLFMWADENPDMVPDIYRVLIGPLPAESPEFYIDRSATYWPKLINVPLLIMHGENDWIVSPDQSRILYDKLKAAGKPATLVMCWGDDHQLTGQQGGFPEAVRWFNRHFQMATTMDDKSDAIASAFQGVLYGP